MSIPIKSAAPPTATAPATDNYSDLNALASLKKDSTSPRALHAVAQQIDALFLQMMLKSMRDADAAGSAGTSEGDSNEMSMYHDMFDKQVALSMSRSQSLGIGAQLTRQLGQLGQAAAATAPPVTAGPVTAGPVTAGAATGAPASAGDDASTTEADAGKFVAEVYPAIERSARALGISPVAMLAQAALETGWGRRMPRGADGRPSLNFFGIKADDAWSGAKVSATTLEFSGGVATPRRTAFRAYASVDASVQDFAALLQGSPRYRQAIANGHAPEAYVAAIGNSGYATDPHYADKLNEVMNGATLRTALRDRTRVL